MSMLTRRCLLLLACTVFTPHARADSPGARATVIVHGTVLDYSGRVVEKARVSFAGQAKSVETDRQGRFTARVPARAFVSASKHDMLGHVVLGDAAEQTVTIRMAQMPM